MFIFRFNLLGVTIGLILLALVVAGLLAMAQPQHWLWLFNPFVLWRTLLILLILVLCLLGGRK